MTKKKDEYNILIGKLKQINYEKNRAIDLYQSERDKNKLIRGVLAEQNDLINSLTNDKEQTEGRIRLIGFIILLIIIGWLIYFMWV